MSEQYQAIHCDIQDSVLTITLNRPEKLNAFNTAMRREIIAAIQQASEDDDVRAIIVTGAGRAFCAGADLASGAETFAKLERDVEATSPDDIDGGGKVSLALYDCKKPIIAAINGAAVGVGATMTLPMDLRL